MKLWWNRGVSAAAVLDDEDEVLLPPRGESAGEGLAAGGSREHPVLVAALASGVRTREEFEELFAVADGARRELQASCEREAVRCFGQEQGAARAKALEGQSYSSVRSMRDVWRETADDRFGTLDARGPGRMTQGGNVDGGGSAGLAAEPVLDVNEIYAERAKQGG